MARRKKNDEEPKENQDNLSNESDDTFGLPEVEYEPLKRDQEENVSEPVTPEPVEQPVSETEKPVTETTEEAIYNREVSDTNYHTNHETVHHHEDDHNDYLYMDQERRPIWPKILIGVAIIALLAGGVYYFGWWKPENDQKIAEKERLEKAALDRAAKQKRDAELAERQRRETEQRRLDSLAAIPKVGSVDVLEGRTGQYYIVVASAIDDDLLMDYANKVVQTGKSVKIIPPFGKKGKFYRLAVDSKDSYDEAQTAADGMKGGDFGDQLWVVRY